jgi:hypothetical protein
MTRTATHLQRRLATLGVTIAIFAPFVPDAFARFYSDERVKDEVEPVTGALEKLRSLPTA